VGKAAMEDIADGSEQLFSFVLEAGFRENRDERVDHASDAALNRI
jgi:hypothetical protein